MDTRNLRSDIAVVTAIIVLLSACSQTAPDLRSATPTATERNQQLSAATPTSLWDGLLLDMPVAFTTPLPEESWTPIDGSYAKLDPSDPQWWACRRCADYRPAGGIWKLQFSKGVMRIYYDVTDWRSNASYTVAGDHLFIFNDPYCPQEVGEYTWSLEDKWGLEDRSLVLNAVKDSCSIGLRGQNLSAMPWESCLPPNFMTGASDHWRKTPGCETVLSPPASASPAALDVSVVVHPGYARKFAHQPDLYVDANGENKPPPEGVRVSQSEDSIPYGLNRVLWGEGSWVEVSTELPFSAMGVQVFGDYTIGWARVLFDGQEIWRGNTSEIWASQGRNGGYIEVVDIEPGPHALRIESMGFDYHPVTVAFFGFSRSGSVRMEP